MDGEEASTSNNNLNSGTHSVIIKDTNGCTSSTYKVAVSKPEGTNIINNHYCSYCLLIIIIIQIEY